MITTAARPAPTGTTCDPASRVTRSLLGYGVVAGPFYVVAILVQSAIRPGFNLLRHDASLLANGGLGWIQVVNFVVTGAMVVAAAIGVGRALREGRGATWGPRLLGLYGLGLVAAGIFVADPMNGFPAGAPAGRPATITAHGMLHIVAAAIAFLALVGACVVIARRFATEGRRAWSAFSYATGGAFLAGFFAIASGSSSSVMVVAFWAALLLVWSWLAAVSVHLYRATPVETPVP